MIKAIYKVSAVFVENGIERIDPRRNTIIHDTKEIPPEAKATLFCQVSFDLEPSKEIFFKYGVIYKWRIAPFRVMIENIDIFTMNFDLFKYSIGPDK